MAQITDLTGTKWEFNSLIYSDQLYYEGYSTFILQFNSDEKSFNALVFSYDESFDSVNLIYRRNSGDTQVYDQGAITWAKQSYRTIEITGGDDTTDTNLISWIQSNATQIIEPQEDPKISIGTQPLVSASVGNADVQSIWVGNVKVYEAAETP